MVENQEKVNYAKLERTEYFKKLQAWIDEVHASQALIYSGPFIEFQASQVINGSMPNLVPSNIRISTESTSTNTNANNQERQDERFHQRRTNEARTAEVPAGNLTGVTYKIPPIWKRFVAELIDSILLFVLKLSLTFIAVDLFDFIDFKRYYTEMLQTNLRVVDYKMALDLTSGLTIIELIHRVFVCIFEASWLQHGRNGRIGGATPGKSLMKIKVVSCQNITQIGRPEDELVLVVPGNDLGLLPALGRSILKNLVLAFFLPISFAMCFFKFNRTFYDLICNTIVVEDPQRNGNNNVPNQNVNNNNNNNNQNFNNNNNANFYNNNVRVHQD